MSCHAVRIKHSTGQEKDPSFVPKPEPPELASVTPERVNQHIKYNFSPVLEEQETVIRKVQPGKISSFSVEHCRGSYRFSGAEDKSSILDSIESKVVADAEWYKIETHECDHDEPVENRTGCGDWKTERTKGSVPEGV